jgi:ribose-phosphate pyrophosphokinase
MTIYLNNKKVPIRIYSGGEVDVNVNGLVSSSNYRQMISAIIRKSDDLMALLLTVDAIRRVDPGARIGAHIPYMPYARQDRVCNQGEALSAQVMANIINSLELDIVYVNTPHSDLIMRMIRNSQAYPMYVDIEKLGLSLDVAVMCADAGMSKRSVAMPYTPVKTEIMHATKKRDALTGNITETSFSHSVKGRNVLVIDDICDGGQTFIELAKVLKQRGAKNLYLYVEFGIFRNGTDEILKYYEKVDCRFDFRQEEWEFFEQ